MPEFKLGKSPARHDPRTFDYAKYRTGVSTPPPNAHWGHGIPFTMLANDKYGDCVSPDTLVLTRDLRWVPAGDLRPGDELLAFDEESRTKAPGAKPRGRDFRTAVVETTDRIRRPCFDLTFEDGTAVRSSIGHQWLSRCTVQRQLGIQVWTRTEDLRTTSQSRVSAVIKPLQVWETEQSFEAGYLAGAYDGEGNLSQDVQRNRTSGSNRLCFSQADNEMLHEAERCLKELGFVFTHAVDRRSEREYDGPRRDIHRLSICERPEWLRFLGSVRPARLLPKVDVERLGRINGNAVQLVDRQYVGEQEVVWLNTSTRTYFANGLASHNCVEAGYAHMVQIWGDRAGNTFVPDDADTLAAYTAMTGFNPDDPSTDKGTDILTAVNYWKSTGMDGHQITAYAALSPLDQSQMEEAIAFFGGAYIGLQLPISAQSQVGQEWTVTQGKDAQAGSWGGHCVPLCGYDANRIWCVTWGTEQAMSWNFLTTYCDEAYVLLAQEWMEASGMSPSNLAWGQLMADLANL